MTMKLRALSIKNEFDCCDAAATASGAAPEEARTLAAFYSRGVGILHTRLHDCTSPGEASSRRLQQLRVAHAERVHEELRALAQEVAGVRRERQRVVCVHEIASAAQRAEE